jgi:hypothetical protein
MLGVVEEIEKAGAGPRIENTDDFAKWLEEAQPPPDVCVALAARAALRALPLILWDRLGSPVQRADAQKKETLRHFRSMAASLITAKFPGSVVNLSDDIYIMHQGFWDVTPPLSEPCAFDITDAVASAELAANNLYMSLFSHPFSSAPKTNQPIVDAVVCAWASINYAATRSPEISPVEAKSAETDYWGAMQRDFQLILDGSWANVLAEKPLWHGKPPSLISHYWGELKDFVSDSDNWWVWKHWYEDILNGRARSEAHDMIYATVPVEEWDKGPTAANAWIAAKLAELDEIPPDNLVESLEKLTRQDPHGASFEIVEGKARIAESLNENDAKVAEDPQTIQLHERVKIRANNARERVQRLANQPGFESIAATVEEYYNYISDDTLSVAANISTVWELSVAIGSFIERDDEIRAGRGGMVSEMEPDARETLDQLIIASAPFVRRFPTARQNDDDVRLFKQSRTSFDVAKRIFHDAVNENLIEHDSNTIINIAINAAENSSGIQSEKSVSWLNFTVGNLTKVLISAVFMATAIPIKVASGYLDKLGEEWFEHSPGGKKALNFLLNNDKHITDLFSNSPPDLKAAHKEIMKELKKSNQSEKHHRK